MLLQRHQVLHGIDPGLHTGGNQTGEETGDGGTRLGGREQGVLALPNEQFEGALGQVIVKRRAANG
jgi:hypothetical protein